MAKAMISVWLGSKASIWAHRGYRVSGETVLCDSREDALKVLHASLGTDLVEVDGEGAYYYMTQEAADADQDGSRADGAIREIAADE